MRRNEKDKRSLREEWEEEGRLVGERPRFEDETRRRRAAQVAGITWEVRRGWIVDGWALSEEYKTTTTRGYTAAIGGERK